MRPRSLSCIYICFWVLLLLTNTPTRSQVLAMQTRKQVEYFKIKWIDIAPKGCTWEPAAHLIGDQAKAALSAFRQQRAAEQEADETIRRARRAGKAAEANAQELSPDDDLRIIDPQGAGSQLPSALNCIVKRANGRKQSSDVWRFFTRKNSTRRRKVFTLVARFAASRSRCVIQQTFRPTLTRAIPRRW